MCILRFFISNKTHLFTKIIQLSDRSHQEVSIQLYIRQKQSQELLIYKIIYSSDNKYKQILKQQLNLFELIIKHKIKLFLQKVNLSNNQMSRRSTLKNEMSIVDLKGVSFKVIIIGDSSVGKTSLIHKYIHGEFLSEYNITVGVDFKSKTVHLENTFVQLQIWDTCGQQIYKSVVSSFYRGASAVFLVYDVSKKKTFENLQGWNQSFDKEGSNLALKFLIGTKCDLQRQVSTQQAQQYMKRIHGSFFIETSSLNGQNIDQLFSKVASALYKHYEGDEDFRRLVKPDTDSVVDDSCFIKLESGSKDNNNGKTLKKNKGCCK